MGLDWRLFDAPYLRHKRRIALDCFSLDYDFEGEREIVELLRAGKPLATHRFHEVVSEPLQLTRSSKLFEAAERFAPRAVEDRARLEEAKRRREAWERARLEADARKKHEDEARSKREAEERLRRKPLFELKARGFLCGVLAYGLVSYAKLKAEAEEAGLDWDCIEENSHGLGIESRWTANSGWIIGFKEDFPVKESHATRRQL